MKLRQSLMLAFSALAIIYATCAFAVDPTTLEARTARKNKREEIYRHMKQEGITRESINNLAAAFWPFRSPQNMDILAEKVLNPGEHYRVEVDEYIMTMAMPDATPGASWMVPYANTRAPEAEKKLHEFPHKLRLLSLMWYFGIGCWPFDSVDSAKGHMSMYVSYHRAGAKYRTPEISLETARKRQLTLIPTPEEEADAYRTNSFLSKAGKRIYIAPEKVVINGRIWSREALQQGHRRKYQYKTTLLPDRMIWITIYMPSFNYVKHPDRAEHPEWLKRAFAVMDETISSIRIAKLKDDGKPDPFVLERVEVAPLPVRPVMNQ